jgi:hypothetical protein
MMEAIRPFKTSVLTRATRHNIPEDGTLHSHAMKTSNLNIDLYLLFVFIPNSCF